VATPKQASTRLLAMASAQVINCLLKASRGVALERLIPLLEAKLPTLGRPRPQDQASRLDPLGGAAEAPGPHSGTSRR